MKRKFLSIVSVILVLIVFLLLFIIGKKALHSYHLSKLSSGLSISQISLPMSGISREYKILFLSDIHAIANNQSESAQIIQLSNERTNMFHSSTGQSSADTLKQLTSYANAQNVDAVVFGGDIIDFPSASNLALLQEALDSLQMPYLFTVGNHDWTYPWDYMTDHGRQSYYSLLQPFMERHSSSQCLNMGEFQIVSVDNSTNQVTEASLEQYKKALSSKKTTLVVMHVPLTTEGLLQKAKGTWKSPVTLGADGIYPSPQSAELISQTIAQDSPVAAVLSGHVHFSYQEPIRENIPQFVTGPGYMGQGIMLHIKASEHVKSRTAY